jgi:type III pantothenate kinase
MPTYSNSLLLIDVGNTNIKYKKANEEKIISKPLGQFEITQLPKADITCVSSVVTNQFEFSSHTLFAKTQKQYKNLINAYDDILQLGVDRWLSLIAIYELQPQQNCLIIDMGSAITIEVLNNDGQHQTGWIMPGFNWLKSTKPVFNDIDKKDTFNAWDTGCRLMIIDTIISEVNKYPNYKIMLTGGGAKYFLDDFEFDYQIYDNLVLLGLEFWHNSLSLKK